MSISNSLMERIETLPDYYDGFLDSAMSVLAYYELTDEALAMLERTPDATTETIIDFVLYMSGRAG